MAKHSDDLLLCPKAKLISGGAHALQELKLFTIWTKWQGLLVLTTYIPGWAWVEAAKAADLQLLVTLLCSWKWEQSRWLQRYRGEIVSFLYLLCRVGGLRPRVCPLSDSCRYAEEAPLGWPRFSPVHTHWSGPITKDNSVPFPWPLCVVQLNRLFWLLPPTF